MQIQILFESWLISQPPAAKLDTFLAQHPEFYPTKEERLQLQHQLLEHGFSVVRREKHKS